MTIHVININLFHKFQDQNSVDFNVFVTVFSYCLLIIVLPITSYFGTQYFLENKFDLSTTAVNIYSAVSAVICLHVALGIYLYKAYSSDPRPSQKQD